MRSCLAFLLAITCTSLAAQTDVDAIRYSRPGTGGTSRFLSTGGAFGAAGADLGVAGTNPGGLALYRHGELSFTGGLMLTTNSAQLYGTRTSVTDAAFVFNNFGIALSWASEKDPENRHVLVFSNTQQANFLSSTRMQGYTNSSSIAKDMVALGNRAGSVSSLDDFYERMAFETYVIDTMYGKFIPMVDVKRTVRQTRDLVTSGRMNELNFSYAFSYKDKYYVGGSLGVPRIEYNSSLTHTEEDDRDSMRISFNADNTWTTTYTDGLPELNDYYLDRGGFNSLSYNEYFRTTGNGLNLKIGGVARVNDNLRLGMYFHTPTILRLTDVYANEMYSTWDKNPTRRDEDVFPPEQDAVFEYRVITPSRVGLNAAWTFGKRGLVALDYETVNYARAQLRGDKISDFASNNTTIQNKYSNGHQVRVGGELNLSPLMLRAGYNMQGSPFGHVLVGKFVKHSLSFGIGFKPGRSLYFDAAWVQTVGAEDYFLFREVSAMSRINYSSGLLSITAGLKF
jgi:hypothetical protein